MFCERLHDVSSCRQNFVLDTLRQGKHLSKKRSSPVSHIFLIEHGHLDTEIREELSGQCGLNTTTIAPTTTATTVTTTTTTNNNINN